MSNRVEWALNGKGQSVSALYSVSFLSRERLRQSEAHSISFRRVTIASATLPNAGEYGQQLSLPYTVAANVTILKNHFVGPA